MSLSDSGDHLGFGTIQNLHRCPCPQTSNWPWTFFAVSYSKPALGIYFQIWLADANNQSTHFSSWIDLKISKHYFFFRKFVNNSILFSFIGLRIHIKRIHETADWTFACKYCDSKFETSYGLKLHRKAYHYLRKKKSKLV